jgi:hypothetical protein
MSPRSPKDIAIRRLPKAGDEITLEATVTRTGRNGYATADTVTFRIPGYEFPVTVNLDSVLKQQQDA